MRGCSNILSTMTPKTIEQSQYARPTKTRSTAGSLVKKHGPSAGSPFIGTLRTVSFSAFNRSTTASRAAPVGLDHCTSTQPGKVVEPS